jgi:hypothetical protein
VVISEFDILSAPAVPPKTDAKLPVDSDAVLPSAIATKSFQTIARWRTEFVKTACGVEHGQLSVRGHPQIAIPLANRLAEPDFLGVLIGKRFEHHRQYNVTR